MSSACPFLLFLFLLQCPEVPQELLPPADLGGPGVLSPRGSRVMMELAILYLLKGRGGAHTSPTSQVFVGILEP